MTLGSKGHIDVDLGNAEVDSPVVAFVHHWRTGGMTLCVIAEKKLFPREAILEI